MEGTAKERVAAASGRLPARQREALELHELHGLSYDEIAARLETSWSSVAQLVAHARINFYDELRGTILASMAPTPDCERAPCLIAARQDGELDSDSAEAAWLDAHLAECQRCERGVEEMRAASAAYRDSVPAAAVLDDPSGPGGRRRLALAVAAAALLLFAGVATAFVRNGSPSKSAEPAADVADRSKPPRGAATKRDGKKASQRKEGSKGKKTTSSDASDAAAASAPTTAPTPSEVPVAVPAADQPASGGGGGSANRPSGDTAVDPPQRTAAPKPKPAPTATSSPTPSAAPAPAPAPVPAPPAEPPPPEEPTEETSRRREPPGKPAHAGPK